MLRSSWVCCVVVAAVAALVVALHGDTVSMTSPGELTYRARFEAVERPLTALGAGGCAAANCHGGTSPKLNERIDGDEWNKWYHRGQGSHFRAFKTLESDRSKLMARILCGPTAIAAQSPQCLGCHGLDVPEGTRGQRFDVTDGVSCEACHGRSELWAVVHTNPQKWSPKNADQRTTEGFYDLRNLTHRAEKCLECHYGTPAKRVTHAMLAAGHPPLTFELAGDLFDVPKHWREEHSYVAADEGAWLHARVWAVGQAVALRETMSHLVQWAEGDAPPDFAMFECFACHHELDPSKDWRQRRGFLASPGEAVFDAGALALSRPLLAMLLPDAQTAFDAAMGTLIRSVSLRGPDRSAVRAAATDLLRIASRLTEPANMRFERDKAMRLVRRIAEDGERLGRLGFSAARQCYSALYALYGLPMKESQSKPANHEEIVKLILELKDLTPQTYDPDRFQSILEDLARRVPS